MPGTGSGLPQPPGQPAALVPVSPPGPWSRRCPGCLMQSRMSQLRRWGWGRGTDQRKTTRLQRHTCHFLAAPSPALESSAAAVPLRLSGTIKGPCEVHPPAARLEQPCVAAVRDSGRHGTLRASPPADLRGARGWDGRTAWVFLSRCLNPHDVLSPVATRGPLSPGRTEGPPGLPQVNSSAPTTCSRSDGFGPFSLPWRQSSPQPFSHDEAALNCAKVRRLCPGILEELQWVLWPARCSGAGGCHVARTSCPTVRAPHTSELSASGLLPLPAGPGRQGWAVGRALGRVQASRDGPRGPSGAHAPCQGSKGRSRGAFSFLLVWETHLPGPAEDFGLWGCVSLVAHQSTCTWRVPESPADG